MANTKQQRQRLLYLHAQKPSIRADVVAVALHEPIADSITEVDPEAIDIPYPTVHAAMVDGWRVVHFPDQRGHFEDREIDVIGYEFILEKIEAFDE